MQKIIFVSIILLIGLFSLQLQLSRRAVSYYKNADQPAKEKMYPVRYYSPDDNRIMYIFPADSTVVLWEYREGSNRL